MDLTCPKCQGAMRQYERNGVTVDQCSECRGIFLDRGELEKLIDGETRWHNAAPQPAPPAAHQQPATYHPQQQHGGHSGYGKPHKRRKSFLEELFD